MSGPLLFFWIAFLSFMPISELRGAIPFALANGVPWYGAWLFAVAMNALVAPGCWLFLSTVHKLFYGRPLESGGTDDAAVMGGGQAGNRPGGNDAGGNDAGGNDAGGNDAVSGGPVRGKTIRQETAYHGGFRWYRKFFDHFVERARRKLHRGLERWGWIALAAFVAVPLPITGAWTGTLGAWVLGLSKRRTLPAVIIGVAVAGTIVTAVALLGIHAFSLFIKKTGLP
ncbi:MAG: small multi-drug export protein [Treponema sp.]|jgi:uncharacterized membrane protein|nr:small multi-drug export protein [Treponema sp.]